MLEHHVKSPVTRDRLRTGLAADHVDGFADWLHRRGYRPITIDALLRSLAGWTDWMRVKGFTAHDLNAGLEACKVALKKEPRARYCRGINDQSRATAAVFVRFLQEQGWSQGRRRRARATAGRCSAYSVHGCASTVG